MKKLNHFSLTSGQFPRLENWLEIAERMLTFTGLRWLDQAWHNDVSPHCTSIESGVPLMLWWDKPGDDGPRFSLLVSLASLTQELPEDFGKNKLYEGDDWAALIDTIKVVAGAPNRIPWPPGLDASGNFMEGADIEGSAREWVRLLTAKGLDYHFDDDPFDQVAVGSGNMPFFNATEAACLNVFVAAYRVHGIDLCGMYFQAMADRGLYDEQNGVRSVESEVAKLAATEQPADIGEDIVGKAPQTPGQAMAAARKMIDDAHAVLMEHGATDRYVDQMLDIAKQYLTDKIEHPNTR